jgi:hypothetical protein
MSNATLEEMLVQLRAMADPAELERIAAGFAAEELRSSLTKTLSAGQTPEGKAWAPTKEGERAYKGAAGRLRVQTQGNLVTATIDGGEAFGHYGAGVPVRQMLPDAGAGIPASVSKVLDKAAERTFEAVMNKKGGK